MTYLERKINDEVIYTSSVYFIIKHEIQLLEKMVYLLLILLPVALCYSIDDLWLWYSRAGVLQEV